MKLVDLTPGVGANRDKKRIGRGIGSPQGRTAGKGDKGQKARNKVRPGFEGGQTPLHRRLPHMRGFTNKWKKVYAVINLSRLDEFETGTVVDPDMLMDLGIIKKMENGLKVLADGELTKPITVKAHKFSKTAEEKIKAAGGSAEVL